MIAVATRLEARDDHGEYGYQLDVCRFDAESRQHVSETDAGFKILRDAPSTC